EASMTTPDASTKTDATSIDLFDAFPIPDGPLGDCVKCIRDQCGTELNACLNEEGCRTGVLCTLGMCLPRGGGDAGINPACIAGCFPDITQAVAAIGGVSCVTTRCADICGVPPDASTD